MRPTRGSACVRDRSRFNEYTHLCPRTCLCVYVDTPTRLFRVLAHNTTHRVTWLLSFGCFHRPAGDVINRQL